MDMQFKNGGLVIPGLVTYINSQWEKRSLNPIFFMALYIHSLLQTLKFVASASLLALVFFHLNNEIYKFVIALIFASPVVPFFIYLKHRKKSLESYK